MCCALFITEVLSLRTGGPGLAFQRPAFTIYVVAYWLVCAVLKFYMWLPRILHMLHSIFLFITILF